VTAPAGKRLRYIEIADDIRSRIRDGKLPAGARIGTFDSLGKDYSAAKGTIDKALDVLRQEGAVVTLAGMGIFVADNPGVMAAGSGQQLAGEVAELRERVSRLEAQVIDLYHSTGRHYSGAKTAGDQPNAHRRASNG
jgi:DNA-binding GntR family transcriptional regulator